MWNWLKKIFIGVPVCEHHWETKEIIQQKRSYRPPEYMRIMGELSSEIVVGEIYLQQCKKCGTLKNHSVKVID